MNVVAAARSPAPAASAMIIPEIGNAPGRAGFSARAICLGESPVLSEAVGTDNGRRIPPADAARRGLAVFVNQNKFLFPWEGNRPVATITVD
ncbi:MAG: hypothetical protein R2861_12490 [Desulfobacterales bacterium]